MEITILIDGKTPNILPSKKNGGEDVFYKIIVGISVHNLVYI